MALPSIARIDRRILYVILILGLTAPLLSPLLLPIPITSHTRGVYDATEALSAGDVAVMTFDFGPATLPENRPQAVSFASHCREKGINLIAVCFWATGAPLGEDILSEVYGEDFEDLPEYGTELVFIGYHPGAAVGISAFGDDTWFTKSVDHFGTPFTALPLMGTSADHVFGEDFDIWMEVMSGTPGIDEVVMYIHEVHGVTCVTAGTAVTIPGAMPYYGTGQVVGLLNGLAGAGEYEKLLAEKYGFETTLIASLDAQSVAHIIIILFVIIGNIGFAYARFGGKEA